MVYVRHVTHYSHKNITLGESSWEGSSREGCRDFKTIDEMNNTIIDGINACVKEDDFLIHCGDVSFRGITQFEDFSNRVNCKNRILIQGNHDHLLTEEIKKNNWIKMVQLGYFASENKMFFVSHYPCVTWHQQSKGSIHIYGHVHGKFQHEKSAMDVGIDNIFKIFGEYRPINSLEILKWIENKWEQDINKKQLI
jgi:calcineurin-like phosphoesterase family protein